MKEQEQEEEQEKEQEKDRDNLTLSKMHSNLCVFILYIKMYLY